MRAPTSPDTSNPARTEPGDDEPSFTRRELLAGIGANVAFASGLLTGCTRAPAEKIVPYRAQPEDVVPGRATHYATAMMLDGYATGLLVESHEGRPTKIEGNPEHPASLGASGVHEQAAVFELYAPQRQRELLQRRARVAKGALSDALGRVGAAGRAGAGVHLVLPPTSSRVIERLLRRLRERLPSVQVHFHAPLGHLQALRGTLAAFGAPLEARPSLQHADVIASLDADFLMLGPSHLARARELAERRRVRSTSDDMNRLYVVEAALSVTGQVADHRLALRDGDLPAFAVLLLWQLAQQLGPAPAPLLAQRERILRLGQRLRAHSRFLAALARDLAQHRSAATVLVGARQPASVQAAAHAANRLLDRTGKVVAYAPSPLAFASEAARGSLQELSQALDAGAVDALVVLEANIAHSTPGAWQLGERLRRAKSSFYLGLFDDETARACDFVVPAAHFLEAWGDGQSREGVASIVQPLIAPLYDGWTAAEILSLLLGDSAVTSHGLTRADFREQYGSSAEEAWQVCLSRGVVPGSGISTITPELSWGFLGDLLDLAETPQPPLELTLTPDPYLLDGRFSDNPWLVELPHPVTKLTWGNALLLAPATARALGVASGDVVRLASLHLASEAPVLVVPEQAEGSVGLQLGWARHGSTLETAGANGFLFSIDEQAPLWVGVTLAPTGRREELPITQSHTTLEGFADSVAASTTLAEFRQRPDALASRRKRQLSLYTSDAKKTKRQWGMSIDLSACTGCAACVVACQAENNVPSVGRSGVLKRREMQWIRIDRYVLDSGTVFQQPMACQHCEQAPCEYVCPTGATLHSSDGLNQMVYNRCVGTRFCSNNCPYKVRRFNWFDYHATEASPRELVYNPNVSVRERGVMEKCTYCVQRIRGAESAAERAGRALNDGDVVTACEQACPSSAIVFGDVADPRSRVAELHRAARAYEVLNELGTVPRTRYLSKLTNPNPELA